MSRPYYFNYDSFSIDWFREEKLPKQNDGNIPAGIGFEWICADLLREELKSKGVNASDLLTFKTEQPDGSIDFYAVTNGGNKLVAECKKVKNSELARETINKLSTKLHKNLLITDGKDPRQTRYAPWFNKELKYYYLCLSCHTEDASDFEDIESLVKAMLMSLSQLPDLLHLNNVKVNILTWERLKGIIDDSPTLRHRWVKNTMVAIEPITNLGGRDGTYNGYLYARTLMYYSRDKYIENKPEALSELGSEREFLNSLINSKDGLVIYGEGGVGKTRLMRELALMAQKENDLIAYEVTRNANLYNVIDFFSSEGGKILLLFDYIEEIPDFEDWCFELTHSARPFEVKILANCRKSYLSSVALSESDNFSKIDISYNETSKQYYNAVIDHIVTGIPQVANVNNRIFRHRPSFAVFVRYLYDTDKVPDLKQNETFRQWLLRRLALSFSKKGITIPKHETIVKLFACMPAVDNGRDFIEEHYAEIVNLLVKDGWLEYRQQTNVDREEIKVIHDTISDELLQAYLLELELPIRKRKVKEFLQFSVQNGMFFGMNRSLERLQEGAALEGIDLADEFGRLIKGYPNMMQLHFYSLVKTPLLSDEELTLIWSTYLDFFIPFIIRPNFAGPLSFLLNRFSKKDADDSIREKLSKVYEIWLNANIETLEHNSYRPKIISTGVKFFGLTPIQKRLAESYLTSSEFRLDDSHVISRWLESGGSISAVEGRLVKWLRHFCYHQDAQYVFKSWLIVGGGKDIIKVYLGPWLKEFGTFESTRFVYCSWLDNGGDKNFVIQDIELWLKEFGTYESARFVYASWLESGGDAIIVRDYIGVWLKEFGTYENAGFVFKSWLESAGDTIFVRDYIGVWLKEFGTYENAGFVYTSWLDAGGNISLVKDSILKWLKKFALHENASFVYRSWLNMGGGIGLVGDDMLNWLKKYALHENASYVYRSWLNVGGDINLVSDDMLNWLKKFDSNENASYIYQSWLNAGGDIRLVKDSILNWLKKFDLHENAGYVYQSWLENGGEKIDIKKHLAKWMKINLDSISFSYIVGRWIMDTNELSFLVPYVGLFLSRNWHTFNGQQLLLSWQKLGGQVLINWWEVNGEFGEKKYMQQIVLFLPKNDLTIDMQNKSQLLP